MSENQPRAIMTCLEKDILGSTGFIPIHLKDLIDHEFKCNFCKLKVYLGKACHDEMKSDSSLIAICDVCMKEARLTHYNDLFGKIPELTY